MSCYSFDRDAKVRVANSRIIIVYRNLNLCVLGIPTVGEQHKLRFLRVKSQSITPEVCADFVKFIIYRIYQFGQIRTVCKIGLSF
jgi:hypothetical protein